MLQRIDSYAFAVVMMACLIVGAWSMVAASGCTGVAATSVGAVIDCTKQNQGKVIDVMLAISVPILQGQKPDWAAIEARALAAGREIGGCALALVVDDYIHRRTGVASDDDAQRARTALEEFRREHAGGAAFVTHRGAL